MYKAADPLRLVGIRASTGKRIDEYQIAGGFRSKDAAISYLLDRCGKAYDNDRSDK